MFQEVTKKPKERKASWGRTEGEYLYMKEVMKTVTGKAKKSICFCEGHESSHRKSERKYLFLKEVSKAVTGSAEKRVSGKPPTHREATNPTQLPPFLRRFNIPKILDFTIGLYDT